MGCESDNKKNMKCVKYYQVSEIDHKISRLYGVNFIDQSYKRNQQENQFQQH